MVGFAHARALHVVGARQRRGGLSFRVCFFLQSGLKSLLQVFCWISFLLSPMADQEAPRRGVRRAAAKADREEEGRFLFTNFMRSAALR